MRAQPKSARQGEKIAYTVRSAESPIANHARRPGRYMKSYSDAAVAQASSYETA